MTIREKCVALREAFPEAEYEKLGRIIGRSGESVKYHTDLTYRAYQQRLNRKLARERSSKQKFILIELLGGRCVECGYRGYAALVFHHKDETQKVAGVSDLLTGKFENALEEVKKCVLLCANCHREHHADNSN